MRLEAGQFAKQALKFLVPRGKAGNLLSKIHSGTLGKHLDVTPQGKKFFQVDTGDLSRGEASALMDRAGLSMDELFPPKSKEIRNTTPFRDMSPFAGYEMTSVRDLHADVDRHLRARKKMQQKGIELVPDEDNFLSFDRPLAPTKPDVARLEAADHALGELFRLRDAALDDYYPISTFDLEKIMKFLGKKYELDPPPHGAGLW